VQSSTVQRRALWSSGSIWLRNDKSSVQSLDVWQSSRVMVCAGLLQYVCRVLVCRVRELGRNKTGFVTKLLQNNSLDPPVHGDTSQYHSLTEEEGGLEENSGRSSLRGHAQLGQVTLHLLKIMPGHSMCKEKTKQK
jgi:hypothetical protein